MLNQQFSPPTDWQAFERFCFDLYRDIWKDDNAQLHGRGGQKQDGVDFYGVDTSSRSIGVQCKGKNGGYRAKLSESELNSEVDKAKNFYPPLDIFIIATSASNDAVIQAKARAITARHAKNKLFEVHVVGWETLRQYATSAPEVAREHLSLYGNTVVLRQIEASRIQASGENQAVLSQTQAIMAKLEALGSLAVVAPEVPGDAADEPLRLRIKDAAELGNGGQAQAALFSLNSLRNTAWEGASPRNRHRILNAIGFVHLSLDQMPAAIEALRQAHAVDPGQPWSLSALAFAEYLDGNQGQAFTHASAALAADPSLEQAAIALIHCADIAIVSISQLPALVPEKLRNTSQVLLALSAAAQRRSADDEALRFAEQAYAIEPDNWRTQGTLAHELIKPVLGLEFIGMTRMIPGGARSAFERGVSLLRQAWQEVSANSFGARMPEFALNLSSALDVLGLEGEAEEVVDHALKLSGDVPFLLQRKVMLLAGRNDWSEALKVIARLPAEQREPEIVLIEARALLDTGKAGEALAAAERLASGPHPTRLTEAGSAVALEARVELGELQPEKVLAAWTAHPNSLVMRIAILEFIERHDDLKVAAVADVDRILKGANDLDQRDVVMAATILRVLGEPSRAADLLAPLTSPDLDTSLLSDRLRALLDADRRRDARTLYESLSPAIQRLSRYVDIGTRLYERIGLLPRARALLESYMQDNPEDLQARLSWVALCQRTDDLPSAQRWLKSVSDSVPGRPRELMNLAHLIDHFSPDPRCFRIAYRALRAAFDDQQIHLGYAVGLFFTGRTARSGLEDPQVVAPDTVVTLRACEGTTQIVRIIETEDAPRLERNEISPSDSFAKLVLGRAVGDFITLPDLTNGEAQFEIVSIRNKYLHAHFDILEHFNQRFPESTAFGSMSLGGDGDPDQFEPLFKMVRRRSDGMRELNDRYREGGLPLAFVAKVAGCSALDVWEDLASGREWSVRSAVGNPDERTEAFDRLSRSEVAVVDPITLHMACSLGFADSLRAAAGTLAVTQSTIDYLLNIVTQRQQEYDSGQRGSMVWTGERYVMHETTPDQLRIRAERAEATLRFAQGCTLVAAEGHRPLPKQAAQLFEGMPRAYLDSALAASDPGRVLLCEDFPMRMVAEAATGAPGVWLQAALIFGRDHGRIRISDCAEATGKLLMARHHFTTFGCLELLYELGRHNWLPMGQVNEYLRYLAIPEIEAESRGVLVSETLSNSFAVTGGDWRFGALCWALVRAFAMSQPDQLPALVGAWLAGVEEKLAAKFRSTHKPWLLNTTGLRDFGQYESAKPRMVTIRIGMVLKEACEYFLSRDELARAA